MAILVSLASRAAGQPLSIPSFFDPHVISHEENYTLETQCIDPKVEAVGARATNTIQAYGMWWDMNSKIYHWRGFFAPVVDVELQVKCGNGVLYGLTKRFSFPHDPENDVYGSVMGPSATEKPTGVFSTSQMQVIHQPGAGPSRKGQVYAYAMPEERSAVGIVMAYHPANRTVEYPISSWESILNGIDFGILPERDAALQGRLDRPVLLVHGRGGDYRDWGVTIAKPQSLTRSVAFQNRWVQDYQDGTLPDMLARGHGLNTSFDPSNPAAGINHNGIYFHNAGPDLDKAPPAVMLQYMTLQKDLERALTDHYGATWSSAPSQQIDVVCHSQGCLIVRDLLRRAPTSGTTGPANPANHIRKIVSVNSPHFGSALVTSSGNFSSEEQATKYGDATARFRDLVLHSHRIADGKLDMSSLSYANASFMDVSHSFGCATGKSDCPLLVEWTASAGAWLYGLFGNLFGSIDVNFTIDGPLLGPWVWDVRTQGKSVASGKIEGNAELRSRILEGLKTESDLGQSASFVKALTATGYPTRSDGSLVEFQALYSGSTRDLTAQLASQISHDMIGFCEEQQLEGGYTKEQAGSCYSIAGEIEKYASKLAAQKEPGSDVEDVKVSNEVREGMRKLRDVWLSNSDLLVERESQDPYGRTGFDPDASGSPDGLDNALKLSRDYRIRRGLARGSRDSLVVHGPFHIADNPVRTGPLMRHRGAPRMGLDLYCALDQVCDLYLQKANTSFPTGHSVEPSEATSSSTVAARSTGTSFGNQRSYTFTGDFDLALIDAEANLTTVSIGNNIQAVRDGDDLVVQTSSEVVKRFPGLGRASLWFRRESGTLTLGFRRGDGGGWSHELPYANPTTELIVSWSGNGSAPLLAGTGSEMDTLPVAASWGALVFHREAANSLQESRPQGMVFNGTRDTIRGIELVYHFSADPACNPHAFLEHAPDASLEIEHLGGEDWRFVLRTPISLAPGERWPTEGPWSVRLTYGDGTAWSLLDDPSRYHNLGQTTENPWIPWRDARGHLVWGEDPPRTIQTALDSTTRLTVQSRVDQELSPWAQPKIRVGNHGSRSVGKIRMGILLTIPAGRIPTLEDWYTPEATLRLVPRQDGRWMLEAMFDQHRIAAGSTVDLGDWGVHLDDWSPWRGPVVSPDWQSDPTIALWDSAGTLLWGHWSEDGEPIVVPPPSTIGSMRVEMRDESPNDIYTVRPRIRLTWAGSTPLTGIRIRGTFTPPMGATAELNSWFPPGCTGGIDGTNTVITCPTTTLSPGAVWPDQAGLVFGLHHTDWSVWDRSDDPSFMGMTADFQDWTRLRVEAMDGTCLTGCTP